MNRDLICLSLFFSLFFLTGCAAAVLFCFIFRFLLTGVGVLAGSLPAEAGDVRLLWAGGSLLLQAGFRTRKDTLEDFPCQGLSLRVSYNKKIYLCGFWRER